jgi:hypothetical protein
MNILTFDIEEWYIEKLYYGARKEKYQEYDELYVAVIVHYELFKQSNHNVLCKGLYECIEDYLAAEVNNQ